MPNAVPAVGVSAMPPMNSRPQDRIIGMHGGYSGVGDQMMGMNGATFGCVPPAFGQHAAAQWLRTRVMPGHVGGRPREGAHGHAAVTRDHRVCGGGQTMTRSGVRRASDCVCLHTARVPRVASCVGGW